MTYMNRAFLLIAIAVSSLTAHATTLFVAASPSTVSVGQSFTIDIDMFIYSGDPVNPNPEVSAFDLAIQYPSFLTYTGVTEEGYFGSVGLLGLDPDSTSTPGYLLGLFDASIDPDPAVLTVDTLFSITFQANDVGTGAIQIVCDGPNDCSIPLLANGDGSIPVSEIDPETFTSIAPEPSFKWVIAPLAGLLLWRQRRFTARSSAR
jgi:hypothetical protein